jgi:hypothetical protein
MAPKQDSEATVAVSVEELRASKDAVRFSLLIIYSPFFGSLLVRRDFHLDSRSTRRV